MTIHLPSLLFHLKSFASIYQPKTYYAGLNDGEQEVLGLTVDLPDAVNVERSGDPLSFGFEEGA
jgi:hypothetical protein